MGLEARNAAWDVEREIDREAPAGASAGAAGARADFLANLGRRVAELSSMLGALEGEPQSARLRDDLRRRVHALGVGARLLKFERLAAEVIAAEEVLGSVAERGEISASETAALRAAFGMLAGLGFTGKEAGEGVRRHESGAPPAGRRETLVGGLEAPQSPSVAPPNPWPLSILVVGPKPLADALVMPTAEGAPAIDVERTDDGLRAIDLARAVAPDVVVIDADRRGARELIEALRKDPLTCGVAIVALGTWGRTEEASGFLAAGVTRAVHKPVSPDALRRVCRKAHADRDAAAPQVEIGRVSLPELAARLGKEVERAIADGATVSEDETLVDLGRGDDVLGAVWTAAARVRDVVTIKSRGEIRFAPGAADRAMPVGGWMNDSPASAAGSAVPMARRGGVRPGPAGAKALSGARVLVADDDPAVAWFLSGVLRAEGATVSEACDGAVALRKAMSESPDLVLSDVLMPNLDGLTLTEMLRVDPLLSDVAVVLLSWKDDLLQRARELGARADAYLRKDASGPTVAARVRELFYPRARLSERIAAGGEVHGRADGFTMRTLLTLVCTHRPACVVEVRDAAYLYEIEIEAGRPTKVTRTAKDGAFVTGAAAFAGLLGVRAGRFVVAPSRSGAGSAELAKLAEAGSVHPSLVEQMQAPAAAARGAVRLLTSAALGSVARVTFDEDWLGGYGALLPSPAAVLVKRLSAGEAPRKLLASSFTSARLFEELVRDAASRGAITAITGPQGEDLLAPAVQVELDMLRGVKAASVAPPSEEAERPASEEVSPSGVMVVSAAIAGEAMMPAASLMASAAADELAARGVPTAMPPSVVAVPQGASGQASSASANSQNAAMQGVLGSQGAAFSAGSQGASGSRGAAFSAGSQDGLASQGAAFSASNATGSRPGAAPGNGEPLVSLGSLTPPPAVPRIEPEVPKAPSIKMARSSAQMAEDDDESPAPRRSKRSEARASKTPAAPGVKAPQSRMGMWIACAVAGIVFAVGARISQERLRGTPASPPTPVVVAAAAPPSAAPVTSASPSPSGAANGTNVVTVPGDTLEDPILPQEAPLRSDEKIPSGQGLLEVIAGPTDEVSIDGRPTVAGPVVKATLAAREKPYEIKVKMRGEERLRFALVKESKRTRVRIAPPWNR